MPSAIRLGHVGIVARNYQAMLDYYTGILGFELAEQTADTSYLRVGVDHHAVALHRRGEKAGLEHVAFQIDPRHTVAEMVKELAAAGIAARVESNADPSIPELASFSDCGDLRVELYTELKLPPPIQKRKGFAPRKFGHLARGLGPGMKTIRSGRRCGIPRITARQTSGESTRVKRCAEKSERQVPRQDSEAVAERACRHLGGNLASGPLSPAELPSSDRPSGKLTRRASTR
jgi:catechol 2,3-dioxygenase-like lactoylglutathione lyase family enzyme